MMEQACGHQFCTLHTKTKKKNGEICKFIWASVFCTLQNKTKKREIFKITVNWIAMI
jgi:hypothetical protein